MFANLVTRMLLVFALTTTHLLGGGVIICLPLKPRKRALEPERMPEWVLGPGGGNSAGYAELRFHPAHRKLTRLPTHEARGPN